MEIVLNKGPATEIASVLNGSIVKLESELALAEVVCNRGGEAHHLEDFLETVPAEVDPVGHDVLCRTEVPLIAQHAEDLPGLSVLEGNEVNGGTDGSVLVGDPVTLKCGCTVASI